MEARKLGYAVGVLDPDPQGPGAQLADFVVKGAWTDRAAALTLAEQCDVLTLDTEHVPADLLDELNRTTPVRPSPAVLRTIQDRLVQREFLKKAGVAQTPFVPVGSEEELAKVADGVGFPCVLKTRTSGYDGKGQIRVERPEELKAAWTRLGPATVAETFLDLEREVSVLLCRAESGQVEFFPLAENVHRSHILYATHAPAAVSSELEERAQEMGATIAATLDHVGMLGVELFVTREGQLLVNELAPRTHNSGHYTFGACETSQFEQHVRAITGNPLGSPRALCPAIMINVLGEAWNAGAPEWDKVLALPGVHVHLYGKAEARPGRKMGHVLILDSSLEKARGTLSRLERLL